MRSIVANFSGHPLSTQARLALESQFDAVIQSEPIQFDFSGDANAQIERICSAVLSVLDKDSALTIIPPGQSTLAILLASYLHGVIGHFPRVCYMELGHQGLYLPRAEYEINPQSTRAAGRFFRMKQLARE